MVQKFSVITYTINPKKFLHPPEDAFKISKKYPIYAVADGLTLEVKKDEKYPLLPDKKISGPKMAAEIFCQEAVEYLEKNYPHFQKGNIKQAFQKANQAIFDFNEQYQGDFSTVASLAVIYNDYLFGARLTDCGIAVIGQQGIKFKTPEFWQTRGRREELKEIPKAGIARRQFIKEQIINNPKLKDSSGKKIGYGVLNGQKEALEFIDFYQVPLKGNEVIIIYSDGFEPYFRLKEFIDLFTPLESQHRNIRLENHRLSKGGNNFLTGFSFWQNNQKTKEKFKNLSEKMASENYKLYGLERMLIAVNPIRSPWQKIFKI